MAAEERRSRIIDSARAKGVVRIAELVGVLDVSAMTIRRDIDVLARRGVVEKVHGGAMLRSAAGETAPRDRVSVTVDDGERVRGHVGIVVPDADYYFPEIVNGARAVFEAASVDPTLAISRYQSDQEESLARRFVEEGCTGLLLAPTLPGQAEDPIGFDWLFELPVPVVLVERMARSTRRATALCSVRTDSRLACEDAVRHLVELGHDGVALLTHGRAQKGADVIDGWRHARDRLGLNQARSPLIVKPDANLWPEDETTRDVLGELRAAGATAVLVQNDRAALALTQHARTHGWLLPEDLSVISYDDELAALAEPALTAVSAPKELVGTLAAELLTALIGDDRHRYVRHVIVEPALVVRDSTAAPRGASLS